jgi:hypothetical protein
MADGYAIRGASTQGIIGRALGFKNTSPETLFYPKPRRANAMDGDEVGIVSGQADRLGRGLAAV